MLNYIQRVLTTIAVALWFGGFTIYTAFVVKVGSRVVGGLEQGYITQQVTDTLQVFAAIMIVAVALDIAVHWRRTNRLMRTLQSVAWMFMLGSLVGLVIVHSQMDELLDLATFARPDHGPFRPLHQRYQLISTILWFATLAYIALMVRLNACGVQCEGSQASIH